MRAQYLQDWIVDPEFPLVWRLQRSAAGSGALGDIGAHIVDLAQYLVGDLLTSVSALTETFVRERPLPVERRAGWRRPGAPRRGPVDVDDAALFLGRFAGGTVASFEATRFATGRKNALRIEVNGSRGSLAFDQERMNELEFYDADETPTPPGSAASSSPSRRTPMRARGGRRGTGSATSTRSPTRSSTWYGTSVRAATPCRRSRTGCSAARAGRRGALGLVGQLAEGGGGEG